MSQPSPSSTVGVPRAAPLSNAQRRMAARARAEGRRTGVGSAPLQDGGKRRTGSSTTRVMEERLAAFAPFAVPCLMKIAEAHRDSNGSGATDENEAEWVVKMKTRPPTNAVTHIALLLYAYLEYAEDRVEPCAKLECWEDPLTIQSDDYRAAIANTLLRQYGQVLRRSGRERIFCNVCYTDSDSSRKLIEHARAERARMNGRLLIHYNGHGLPAATSLGEIWMLDKEHKNFVPFSLLEIEPILDGPVIIVLDVDSAASVLAAWYKNNFQERKPNVFFLCACDVGEALPRAPGLPADLLTACLTTPLRMAIEWYLFGCPHDLLLPNVSVEAIRRISTATETPMYKELFLALNAVLDTVAWCTLTRSLFKALYRHDRTTKTLFRHFVLASYIGVGAGVHPISHPSFSSAVAHHYMIDCWEYTLEKALSQLPALEKAMSQLPNLSEQWDQYVHYTFFDEQLASFNLWVDRGETESYPDMLPCVLQALGQRRYELRALYLLIRFMDVSRTAASAAILCGIVPYLNRLYERDRRLLLLVLTLWMQCVREDLDETVMEIRDGRSVEWMVAVLRLTSERITLTYIDADDQMKFPSSSPKMSSPFIATVPRNVVRASASASGARAFSSERVTEPMEEPLQPVAAPARKKAEEREELLLLQGVSLDRCKAFVCYTLSRLQEVDPLMSWNARLLEAAYPLLTSPNPEVCSWACLAVSSLCTGLRHAKTYASQYISTRLTSLTALLHHASPVVRSSCVTLMGSLVGARVDLLCETERQTRQMQMEKALLIELRQRMSDASMIVRQEICFFAAQLLYAYYAAVERRSLSSIQEYVLPAETAAEGKPSSSFSPLRSTVSPWALEGVEVRVKSSLHANRPTDNTQFANHIHMDIQPLHVDDAEPEFPLMTERLDSSAVQILQGLVKDSALILYCLYQYGDTEEVLLVLQSLSEGKRPTSKRVEMEAIRTMSKVNCNSVEHPSEADRIRTRWNFDAMKQIVMDMEDRRLEPMESLTFPLSASSGRPLRTSYSARPRMAGAEGSSTTSSMAQVSTSVVSWAPLDYLDGMREPSSPRAPAVSCYHLMPSDVNPQDPIVAAAFRTLEPQLVVCSKSQVLHVISYESFHSQRLVDRQPLTLPSPVRELHVINDLSEESGLLVVTKQGRFVAFKSGTSPHAGFTPVSTFSACPSLTSRSVALKSDYLAHKATLFYGGPIGAEGGTEIHLLSLIEEQVFQELRVVGTAALTALRTTPGGQAVFAGFDDGVVRYYDDRQASGKVGAVAEARCVSRRSTSSAAGRSTAAGGGVVGLGPLLTGTLNTVVACTPEECCVFDIRKWREPVSSLPHHTLYRSGVSTPPGAHESVVEASVSAAGATCPSITRCSVSPYTGLLAMCFEDAKYGAFNPKGHLLCDQLLCVSGSRAYSDACIAHPLRPFMSMGGDLVIL